MLDFVFVALFAVIPVMAWSIYLVKFRQPGEAYKCEWHKRIQIALAVILWDFYRRQIHAPAVRWFLHGWFA